MSERPKESWGSGDAYELWVGRWSRIVGEAFVDWLAIPPGQTWGDVGCGTGALAECILGRSDPGGVLGVDRSEAYVCEARNRVGDARARFEVGDACALPWTSATCDVTVSGLVLNFVPDSDAMVHEMVRVTRPGGRVAVGQTIEALILGIDWARDRITLSVKGTLPDPWENVETRYPNGSRHQGTVARLADFGAFITLEEGVDGLIPISRLSKGKKIRHPREVLTQGDKIEVVVESADKEKRRLSLSPVAPEEEREDSYSPYLQKGARGFGSLGDMMNKKSPKDKKS